MAGNLVLHTHNRWILSLTLFRSKWYFSGGGHCGRIPVGNSSFPTQVSARQPPASNGLLYIPGHLNCSWKSFKLVTSSHLFAVDTRPIPQWFALACKHPNIRKCTVWKTYVWIICLIWLNYETIVIIYCKSIMRDFVDTVTELFGHKWHWQAYLGKILTKQNHCGINPYSTHPNFQMITRLVKELEQWLRGNTNGLGFLGSFPATHASLNYIQNLCIHKHKIYQVVV